VRPHAAEALAEAFGLDLEPLPAHGERVWPQPIHAEV
jgi:hypothetical protein